MNGLARRVAAPAGTVALGEPWRRTGLVLDTSGPPGGGGPAASQDGGWRLGYPRFMLDDLLEEDDLGGALRAVIGMQQGRTEALSRVAEHFAGQAVVRPIRPEEWVLLLLTAPPEADADWDRALQYAAWRLEEHGMPTLDRSADPYRSTVATVCVLCPALDEAAWRAVAAEVGASVEKGALGDGLVLFDAVAGTGHGRAFLPGPNGWQDWWWEV